MGLRQTSILVTWNDDERPELLNGDEWAYTLRMGGLDVEHVVVGECLPLPADATVELVVTSQESAPLAAVEEAVTQALTTTCGRCKGKGTESWQVSRNPADGREDWPCVRCKGKGSNTDHSAVTRVMAVLKGRGLV